MTLIDRCPKCDCDFKEVRPDKEYEHKHDKLIIKCEDCGYSWRQDPYDKITNKLCNDATFQKT
jgi:hypothetical protein